MKRLALVLAAAVLGTGCHSSTTYTAPPPVVGNVTLYWDFLRHAPAQAGGAVTYDAGLTGASGACPESAVDTVTVDVDGTPMANVSCILNNGVQGVTLTNLLAGTSSFRVSGWRGSYAVYDTTVSLAIPPNSTATYTVDVPGVSAAADLFAALFADGGTPTQYATCGAASNPTIDYQISDSAGTLIDSAVAVPCTDPAYPSFPVFVGDLDLDNYTVRMEGYNGSTLNFDSCTSSTAKLMGFDHFGSQTGGSGIAISLYYPPRCSYP